MARIGLAAATAAVAERDPALARIIDEVGPIAYRPRNPDGPFATLVRAIVFQQLAGRAAQAILGRVIDAIGGVVTPEALVATSDEKLRAAGLSANKLLALRDLSTKTLDGTINLNPSTRDTDDSIVERLVLVRGIGRWTAEMFLMFELRRLDVWPVDDLGVRQGYGLIFGVDPPPTAKQLEALGEPFRPYRSVVARYCWEAVARRRAADPSLR
jgi:3-methyladenine DNA glycosylase/8-oxoguanine DNA glycosylase